MRVLCDPSIFDRGVQDGPERRDGETHGVLGEAATAQLRDEALDLITLDRVKSQSAESREHIQTQILPVETGGAGFSFLCNR